MDRAATDGIRKLLDFPHPAFRSAELRLVGDLCSDPLTRAIRNDVLAFRRPAWSSDAHRALVRFGERRSDAVVVALGRNALPLDTTPAWSRGAPAVKSAFALRRRLHLFRAEPSVSWTTFTEPQFTKGFAYFMDASRSEVRIERVRAFLKALGAAALVGEISEAAVSAEALTSGGRRIDLLIEWWDSLQGRYAAAVEAKLGHHVTGGQLPAYRNHLRKVARERRLLAVVAPRLTVGTDRSLRRNRDWRWVAWRDLLIAHERALPDEYDEHEYARFRRSLWNQTG